MPVITSLDTFDIRFPTSRELDGSDAMNADPDYSAAYLILRTDDARGLCGHGFAFTIGRGNDVQTAAIAALRPYVVGLVVEEVRCPTRYAWVGSIRRPFMPLYNGEQVVEVVEWTNP